MIPGCGLSKSRLTLRVALRGHDESCTASFLAAYAEHRQLAAQELEAIETFVWVRHLWWFALQSEVEAIGTPTPLSKEFLDKVMLSLRERSVGLALK